MSWFDQLKPCDQIHFLTGDNLIKLNGQNELKLILTVTQPIIKYGIYPDDRLISKLLIRKVNNSYETIDLIYQKYPLILLSTYKVDRSS